MARLDVEFLGFPMINPFMLSSAPPTNTVDMIRRAFQKGWAGAVTKTIPLEKVRVKNCTPRLHSVAFPSFPDQPRAIYGFGNIELVSEKHADYWMDGIASLRTEFPDRFLMASIMAEGDAQADWVELAQRAEQAGACAIELNFSCPHGGMPPHAVGAAIGQDPVIAARITRWVKAAVRIPVIAKLTAAVTDIREIGAAIQAAGIDGFCTINSFPVLIGVDLDTFSPLPSVAGKGNHGGYSGRALKPIALRATSEIAPLGLPVSACGGLATWEDAAEFVLVGATTLQVCSAVMNEGYDLVNDLVDGLSAYLDDKGLSSLNELRGRALPNLTPHARLDTSGRKVSSLDPTLCTRCGRCIVSCRDAGYQAISEGLERLPAIDETKCDGCGLCVQVCPVWGCMRMKDAAAR